MSTETSASIGTLTNTLIQVADLEAALPFYRDTLGLSVQAQGDGWVVLDGGAGVIVLVQSAERKIVMGFTGADLAAAREQLEARGAQPTATAAHPNGEYFNVLDPEGNTVMIST